MPKDFNSLLQEFEPITLQEMSSIHLMNRIDRKYLCTEQTLSELLERAKAKYLVQKTEGQLVQNYETVYLDDSGYTMYTIHHNRHLTRQKVRIRTYIESELCFFEIKVKNNHGRTRKKRMELPLPDNWNNAETVAFLNRHAVLPIAMDELQPKIRNRFQRITLVNRNLSERLTIDLGLEFFNLESGISQSVDRLVILELKRDGNIMSPSLDIFRELRIKPSGFSKYCIGMALTCPGLKTNNFKTKLRKIEKLRQL